MKKQIQTLFALALVIFLITTNVQALATNSGQIITYGEEAKIFISKIMENPDIEKRLQQQDNTIIVVSDLKDADVNKIVESIKKGSALVAINLPLDNKLVSTST